MKHLFETNKFSKAEFVAYLNQKGRNHPYYKYYSPKYKVDNIVATKSIYLSSGKDWNDTKDSKKIGKNCFATCFSCTKIENVAMWMLYGGINGDGAMIDFSKSVINNIVDSTKSIELGAFVDDEFCRNMTLTEGQFTIEMIDIVYSDKVDKSYNLRRQDELVLGIDEKIYEMISGFCKSYSWRYESECRMIIKVDKKIKIDDSINTARVLLSDRDLEEIKKNITLSPLYDGKHKSYKQSALKGEVCWDLCKNCKKVK
ncbi:MAG: DUF2971 domain-containing protein [Ruminococcus sp.]|nr:DUF2971 domain-containing protein [Ruminococcus sp.]